MSMRLGWLSSLSLSLGLLMLLSACQPGPNARSYARTPGYTTGYASYDRGGCGYNPCRSVANRPHCPPGQILGRVPYSQGGPGRVCVPYRGRLSSCGGPAPSPCGDGYGRSRRALY